MSQSESSQSDKPSGATPRTDAVLNAVNDSVATDFVNMLQHARQLERELAEERFHHAEAERLLGEYKIKCDALSAALPLKMDTGGGDLEILRMALGNTAACLGDALATFNRLVGEEVFRNSTTPSAREEWHPASEQPNESGWYLVWNANLGTRQYECIERAYFYTSSGLWGPTEKNITAWRHMPPPPREQLPLGPGGVRG